jgi:hypothetical protein
MAAKHQFGRQLIELLVTVTRPIVLRSTDRTATTASTGKKIDDVINATGQRPRLTLAETNFDGHNSDITGADMESPIHDRPISY